MGGIAPQLAKLDEKINKFEPSRKLKLSFEKRAQNAILGKEGERGQFGDMMSTTSSNFWKKTIEPTEAEKNMRKYQASQSSNSSGKSLLTS